MNYYLDTEFIHYRKQPKLLGLNIGAPIVTLDLISIGIVSEDGREMYAISNQFDLNAAWKNQWVRHNVLGQIHREMCEKQGAYAKSYHWRMFEPFSAKSIKWMLRHSGESRYSIGRKVLQFVVGDPDVRLYGYFSDYDYVALGSLFGIMTDMGGNLPMHCMDLKQMMVERGLDSAWKDANCPDPENEHNALADARWNKRLHEAILSVKP